MRRFESKVALVSGAASGMGRASAIRLAAEGAHVVVGDIDVAGAEATAKEITAAGGGVSVVPFDAADDASCVNFVAQAAAQHDRLDIVVNVAGIGGFYRLDELETAIFQRFLAINLVSPMVICREAVPHLEATGGCIINFASINARIPVAYHAAYDASKAGVLALTKSIAQECIAKGVRCNAICPGGFDTNMNKTLRMPEDIDLRLLAKIANPQVPMADPDQIAGTVAFLASEDARFINAEEIVVDGGVSAIL